jgi:VanZ family protein
VTSRAWRILFVAMLVVVLWLAFSPRPPRELDTGWDKLNHALAFGALALSGRFGFPGTRWRVLGIALALLALGVAIEAVQSLLPTRSAELADVLADGVGIAAGLAAASLALTLSRR